MHQKGLVNVLLDLKVHNLTKTLKETKNFISILISMPMCSSETKKKINFKRIKTFLKNTMDRSRLNNSSLIYIYNDLIKNCTSIKEELIGNF